MKKFTVALMLCLFTFAASGCRTSTDYGECIGVQDDKNPNLEYHVSVRNTVLGLLFIQAFMIPTAIWLFADFQCPTGPHQD